jgi:hypothetical protein
MADMHETTMTEQQYFLARMTDICLTVQRRVNRADISRAWL